MKFLNDLSERDRDESHLPALASDINSTIVNNKMCHLYVNYL